MSMLDDITRAMDSTAAKMMPKAKPVTKPTVKELPRVKSPHEYEDEDMRLAEARSNALRDKQTHKLVPDRIYNYGQ